MSGFSDYQKFYYKNHSGIYNNKQDCGIISFFLPTRMHQVSVLKPLLWSIVAIYDSKLMEIVQLLEDFFVIHNQREEQFTN